MISMRESPPLLRHNPTSNCFRLIVTKHSSVLNPSSSSTVSNSSTWSLTLVEEQWAPVLEWDLSVISVRVVRVDMPLQVGHVRKPFWAERACQKSCVLLADAMDPSHVSPQVVLTAQNHAAHLTSELLPAGNMNELVACECALGPQF